MSTSTETRKRLITLLAQQNTKVQPCMSIRFSRLQWLFRLRKIIIQKWQNNQQTIAKTKQPELFPHVWYRHQSLLLRRLGNSDMQLQQNKIINLRRALLDMHGLVIQPGETFSFWETLGYTNKKKGYTTGLLLKNGKPITGIGGGLCQLANLLHWMFLHTDLNITHRYHHSIDAFPDNGRVLPFGSGATVYYNYYDLQVKNTTKHPVQMELFLTEKHMKGRIRSTFPIPIKWHVYQKEHTFVVSKEKIFRYNQLWRNHKIDHMNDMYLFENFAPVAYKTTADALVEKGYSVTTIADEELESSAL